MEKFEVDKSDEEIQEIYGVEISDSEFSYLGDSVGLYLKEIGKFPLLTLEEELKYTRLYKETGDKEYKDILVTRNLRLVVNIAKTYRSANLPFLDIIQEGNLGLMRSIETFEPDMGYRLSTYSYWWINQSIQRYIFNNSDTIRLPVHVKEKQFKFHKFVRNYRGSNLGKLPTHELISESTGLSEQDILAIEMYEQGTVSIETPVGEDGDSILGDFISSTESVENEVFNSDLRARLYDAMDILSERELEVIELRFGLKDNICHTLNDIGENYGICRERIRQIEQRALRKLRVRANKINLKEYME